MQPDSPPRNLRSSISPLPVPGSPNPLLGSVLVAGILAGVAAPGRASHALVHGGDHRARLATMSISCAEYHARYRLILFAVQRYVTRESPTRNHCHVPYPHTIDRRQAFFLLG